MDKCDAIAWLVDLLGTIDLIEVASDSKVYVDKRADKDVPGLYFFKGHWYCSKGGVVLDSYSLKYQMKGTAHFCQTFATMISLGETKELAEGKLADNIKAAMDFWIKFFTQQVQITKWFLKNVHTSDWKDDMINLQDLSGKGDVPLSKLNAKDLISFLRLVKQSAGSLVGCRQG